MSLSVFDPTPCALGEGPLWHPTRQQLFWFDILGKRLRTRSDAGSRVWQFDEHVSAAGWIDDDSLLIASQTRLFQFDLTTETQTTLAPLEPDTAATRSNDGRADPRGGLWIGTMNIDGSPGGGAIYRFFKGEVRKLFAPISISNAICFTPDGSTACFTDTPTRIVQRVALDSDGWPKGDPQPWLDLNADALNPDGAVIDSDGNLWLALWGAGRVACYDPDGKELHRIDLPAAQTTCPAFGGADLSTLYVTSAAQGDDGLAAGQTFATETGATGQREHRILL